MLQAGIQKKKNYHSCRCVVDLATCIFMIHNRRKNSMLSFHGCYCESGDTISHQVHMQPGNRLQQKVISAAFRWARIYGWADNLKSVLLICHDHWQEAKTRAYCHFRPDWGGIFPKHPSYKNVQRSSPLCMTFTVIGTACRASSSRLAVCARVSTRIKAAQFNPLECYCSRLLLPASRDGSGQSSGNWFFRHSGLVVVVSADSE